mmetsp:Transcript_26132/g.104572  ORF Transcript_26132/g.104572 Transcript_26132/m.104572 type:complete len:440 (+) Transcript_26132:1021-2340(+)
MIFEPGQLPNVVARMTGQTNKTIYAGNHRDAWVYGAVDPHSGTVALMEAARAFGALRASGWTPKRSIVFGSWSGEEYGLLGSTAFAELHAAEIAENGVAYVNLDVAVSGNATLEGAGTQSLDRLFAEAVRDVEKNEADHLEMSPSKKANANAAAAARVPNTKTWRLRPHAGDDETKAAVGENLLGTVGSGSDYTAFVDNLGIPSVDFSFKSPDGRQYGTYHSIYDSFTYIDSGLSGGWDLHATASALFALTIYRLADRDVVPIDPLSEAIAIHEYVEELEADSTSDLVDLAPLVDAASAFFDAASCASADAGAADRDAAREQRLETTTDDPAADINARLEKYERQFLSAPGLPDRPWYKHVLQAPGYYLGYGSTAFPGVAHALEDGRLDEAQQQVDVAADRINAAAAVLCPAGLGAASSGPRVPKTTVPDASRAATGDE